MNPLQLLKAAKEAAKLLSSGSGSRLMSSAAGRAALARVANRAAEKAVQKAAQRAANAGLSATTKPITKAAKANLANKKAEFDALPLSNPLKQAKLAAYIDKVAKTKEKQRQLATVINASLPKPSAKDIAKKVKSVINAKNSVDKATKIKAVADKFKGLNNKALADKYGKLTAAQNSINGTNANINRRKQVIDAINSTSKNGVDAKRARDLFAYNGTISAKAAIKLIASDKPIKGLAVGQRLKFLGKVIQLYGKESGTALTPETFDKVKKIIAGTVATGATLALLDVLARKKKLEDAGLRALTDKDFPGGYDPKDKPLTPKQIEDFKNDKNAADKQARSDKVNDQNKAARRATIDKMVANNQAAIAKLKLLDNDQRKENKVAEDAHRSETKNVIDGLKAQFKLDLANAPKGERAAMRKEQAEQLKAYRMMRKEDLAELKADNKAKALKIKEDASKAVKDLRDFNDSLLMDGVEATGFYTDKNGKKRPITTAKGT
jgi:hypothetical protein